jgi:hypothetical protein
MPHDADPDGPCPQALERQALETPLKALVMACLAGEESRRWTLAELDERLKGLGVPFSRAGLLGALVELEAELRDAPWAPWRLVERGAEWLLLPKNDLLGLAGGLRAVPVAQGDAPLSDEEKAVLLVVLAHRRRGGVSRTRVSELLRLDAAGELERLQARGLIRPDPSLGHARWLPCEGALLRLGYRTFGEIPALKPLEDWFTAQEAAPATPPDEALERVQRSYRRWLARQSERRASAGGR